MILEHLIKQTKESYTWVENLIKDIPFDVWDTVPKNIESNMTWQVGHLLVSYYFHSIWVIKGHNMEVLKKIPLQEYSKWFTKSKAEISVGKIDPTILLAELKFMEEISLKTIATLSEADLEEPLEQTEIPHPIAKTKLEALDWNIKHTMWHCGQIAIINRTLHKRYEFGLQLKD